MDVSELTVKDGIIDLGVFEKNEDAWVNTQDIALLFDKEHKNLLTVIRDQILPNVSTEFSRLNFPPSKYKDSRGKMQPCFNLNRKSFAMVVMGFTGAKAMQFKEKYIEAFEAMNTIITTRQLSKAGYKEMSSTICRLTNNDKDSYAKEATMINEIVLGMRSSDFKAVNGIKKGEKIRDAIVHDKLEQLDKAQRLNAQLLLANIPFDERKRIVKSSFGSYFTK